MARGAQVFSQIHRSGYLSADTGGCMHRRMVGLGFVCAFLCAGRMTLQAQEFKVFDRKVQVHGFVSQGFVYTSNNNWLTMNTSQGSAAFTDFGVNLSSRINDKLRVGAQLYDRNLGQLGQYHPSLDWAVVDYRFRNWFCFRKAFIPPISGTRRSLTWAAISTALFP